MRYVVSTVSRRTLLLLTLALATLLEAADTTPRWRTLNQTAREAAQAKDYSKLHSTLLELKPLIPGNPRITYNLAASDALLGNRAVALAELRNLAGMGLVYDLKADEDSSSLREFAEFAAVLKQIDGNKKPVTHSVVAFTLPERDLLPEDIAYDPKTRRFFVSSVRKGIILTIDGEQFVHTDWSVLALRVDRSRRILWATPGWVPHCERWKSAGALCWAHSSARAPTGTGGRDARRGPPDPGGDRPGGDPGPGRGGETAGFTRARLTQMLGLTLLAPDIQEAILNSHAQK
jgi:hypothetical protein